jgi:uncharacterized membrane protein YdjX (TVP38/TMEM64 family)
MESQAVQAYAAANGMVGAAVFAAAYVVATVLLVPASALTLAAGAVYGESAAAMASAI